MKKLLLIAIMFATYGVSTSVAQSCAAAKAAANNAKQCSSAQAKADKTNCTSNALNDEQKAMAIQVASTLEDVNAKVCEASGNVSFTKTSKCCTSGKEKVETVNFDPETKKFINVSPSEAAEAVRTSVEGQSASEAKSCSKTGKAAKKCNSSANAGKACCKSKKGSASNAANK